MLWSTFPSCTRIISAAEPPVHMETETFHSASRRVLGMPKTLRDAEWKVSVSIWTGGSAAEIIRVQLGKVDQSIGLAVDVGTTTVAAYLCDLGTGEVLGTDSMMNPQVSYGEDVMSRITYTMSHDDC